MKTTIKLLIYALFLMAVFAEEYNVPVMMHIKRMRFLADWKLASLAQRQALKSYRSYQDEAENVRGGF